MRIVDWSSDVCSSDLDSVYANRSRPCLLHQIGRCSAPCVNLISLPDYQADVDRAVRFLDGHAKEVMDDIEGRMMRASEALDFEQAAVLRDQMADRTSAVTGKGGSGGGKLGGGR